MRTLLARVALFVASGLLTWVPEAAAVTPIGACPSSITASGTYRLTANLSATGNCITVDADSVTIDLNGFEIRGDTTGSAIEDAASHKTITIRDGTISNFFEAIRIDSSTHGTLDGVVVFDNFSGIQVGDNSTIKNSTSYNNSTNAASTGHYGHITGNTIFKNSSGIYSGSHMIISGNALADNLGHGIITGLDSTVKDNAVVGSGQIGITGGTHVTSNTVIKAGDRGIVVGGESSVKQNVVHASVNAGIEVVGADSVVAGNIVQFNGGYGISVVCPATVKDNTALHNTGGNLNEIGAGCVNTNNNAP